MSACADAGVEGRGPGGSPAGGGGVHRVALVTSELRPGGAERVVAHLGAALRARGMEVRVVTLGPRGPLADDLEEAGVSVACLDSTRGYDVGCLWRLRGILRRFRPDVVHVHDRTSLPYVMAAARLGGSPPVVYTGHGLMFGEFDRPRRRHRWAARGLAAVTAVSGEVARRHAQYLGWAAPVDIVPNGVPDVARGPGERAAARDALGISEDAFVFLAVGNARPEKAFEDLLRAAALVRDAGDGRPFHVVIAGKVDDTPYCRDLLARHEAMGLALVVRFLGFRRDVQALYAAADAFVLSSRSEGLPMVLLEAMMAGLPVVATRVGGVPETVSEGTGLLVEAQDPKALAGAMRQVLVDGHLAQRLGAAARELAEREYSLESMTAGYLRTYCRVVEQYRGTARGEVAS